MKQTRALVVLCGLSSATLLAQTRDVYQQVYHEWQQDDANLVRDASRQGKDLTPRTEQAAAEASKFVSARKAFYEVQQSELAQKVSALQELDLPTETDDVKAAETFLSSQETAVSNSIQLFGGDSDPGIQRLRQALEKERLALIMLRRAITARENVMDTAKEANDKVDHASTDAAAQVKSISASFAESEQSTDKLAEAWPYYYRALADGARGLRVSEVMPGLLDPPSNSAPAPPSRFAGLWGFEFGISTYKGPSPFSFDLLVREEGGQIFGTLSARFLVTGKVDPNVRFDFSGPVHETGPETFPLQASEGAKGTVELIPGTAPNLLEVNFKLDGPPGKVREAGVVLVKR